MAEKYDVIIVGAGIFGLTIANLSAEDGKRVLVIDKRDHLGGNAYSEFDPETGIEVHKYGAHLFHTSDERVWNYVNKFTSFTNYVHKVYTVHAKDGQPEVFPMPINLGTINQFFRAAMTPGEAQDLVAEQASQNPAALENREPQNLYEQGISLIGEPLFNAFIKNYTAKQWQTPAEELSAEIIKRLPVRYNYDNRYFNNTFEGLPTDGYGALFATMADHPNITVKLSTDFFDVRAQLADENPTAQYVYTGPIDAYFDYQFGELTWRSLDLVREVVDVDDYQGCPVMNFADAEGPAGAAFTRIHEFKHFHPERTSDGYAPGFGKTVVVKEYSKTWERGEEPYYPVNTAADRDMYARYKALADAEPNTLFGGRLGEYAYYDMDKVFASALTAYAAL